MLKGKLVTIRTIAENDLQDFCRLIQDTSDLGEFMPVSMVSEVAIINEFHQTGHWKDHCGKLVIEDNHGQLIGEAGFFNTAHYMDGREVYYRIFSGFRGKGYASECLRLLVKYFFKATFNSYISSTDAKRHYYPFCNWSQHPYRQLRHSNSSNFRDVFCLQVCFEPVDYFTVGFVFVFRQAMVIVGIQY